MKTRYSIFIICLLALIATGCKKESNGRIRIFAENMRNDSKILIDPEDIDESTWALGESILIGGSAYEICEDEYGFYINGVVATNGTAIYPGSGDDYNDIEVSGSEVVLKRLAVNFISDNGFISETQHSVVFPMAAVLNDDDDELHFQHLTGGLMLTLQVNSQPVEVASVKIVAQSASTVQNLGVNFGENSVTARWAVQGPTLPHGEVGENEDDYNAAYACEMNINFTNTDNGTEVTRFGATISYDGLTFCVPITINSLHSLTVTGYSSAGAQLFHITKDLLDENDSPVEIPILRNTMYTIPTIEIN